MKKILIISILALSFLGLKAQDETIGKLEEKAVTAYTNSNMFMWKQIAQEANKLLSDNKSSIELKTRAIKLRYGFLYCCLSNQDKETYEQNIESIEGQLNKLLTEYPESSDLYTISAAVMSVQMAFNPMKGATLGSLSSKYIDKAIKLDSLNANAWRQYANSKYFTPKMWGGDINKAITAYKQAILLYEKAQQTNNWLYLDSMVWLGQAYEKTEDNAMAIETYEKVLGITPEFAWVKNQLLPNLKKS